MSRIPLIIIGLLIGTAIAQLMSNNMKAAVAAFLLSIGAHFYNHVRASRETNKVLKKTFSHSVKPAPQSVPVLKIFTICTAGSCLLALAASNYLQLATFATVFIALILTLTTTIISLILFHINTQ